jgi:hypothetical protein
VAWRGHLPDENLNLHFLENKIKTFKFIARINHFSKCSFWNGVFQKLLQLIVFQNSKMSEGTPLPLP